MGSYSQKVGGKVSLVLLNIFTSLFIFLLFSLYNSSPFTDMAIAKAVMDEMAPACEVPSTSRPSPRQRRLIVALKAESATAVESHDALRGLSRRYAQSDLVERWGW